MPGYTHLQRAVVSSAGHVVGGLGRRLHRRRAARRATRWRGSMPIRWAPPPATASTCRWIASTPPQALGFARMQVSATYAQLSRGKFEMAAIEALGFGAARPASPGLGPEPVHQRRIRLRGAAGAVHHRQFDHAEQAQSRRDRTDARDLRQRRRRAHRDRTTAVAAVGLPPRPAVQQGRDLPCLRPRPGRAGAVAGPAAQPAMERRDACAPRSTPSMYATDLAVDLARRGRAVPRGLRAGGRSGALGAGRSGSQPGGARLARRRGGLCGWMCCGSVWRRWTDGQRTPSASSRCRLAARRAEGRQQPARGRRRRPVDRVMPPGWREFVAALPRAGPRGRDRLVRRGCRRARRAAAAGAGAAWPSARRWPRSGRRR